MANRTNLCTNPSLETNLTGWTAYNANTTITRDTTDFRLGIASCKVVANTATTYYGAYIANTGLTIGQWYTVSCYVKNSAGTN